MKEQADYLTEVLDKVEAMIDCGAATQSELAAFLTPDKPSQEGVTRVAEWVRRRVRRPNGEMALRLHRFAEVKTLEISHSGRTAEDGYAKALKAIKARNGGKA